MKSLEKNYTIHVQTDLTAVVPNILATSQEQAFEIAEKVVNKMQFNQMNVANVSCSVVDVQDLEVDIMNDTNSHNKELVNRINNLYANTAQRKHFEYIVSLLMERDREECNEKEVEDDIHLYLMRVADDNDLILILSILEYT